MLIIISISTALVGPRLSASLSKTQLRNAAKSIAAALRYARSQAASEKIPYSALFDFDANRVSVVERTPPDREQEEPPESEQQGRGKSDRVYWLPDGVRLEKALSGELEADAGLFEITFFPAGGSSGGTITVINDRERRYRIAVDFITGAARVSVADDDD